MYFEKTTLKVWITRFDNEDIFYIDTFLDSINISDSIGKEIIL